MQVKHGTFKSMAEDVLLRKSKIVIFGTGVIGETVTPELVMQNGLGEYVQCFIDNDSLKWGKTVSLGLREIEILNPKVLDEINEEITVLVAISRYSGVIDQLESYSCSKEMTIYVVPELCINSFRNSDYSGAVKESENPLIPRKIHYMWLGGKPLPASLEKCIETWKEFCPDYEIIRWDESNYDVHKNKFVSEAYDNGKWGFVPDFARLDILYTHGGIYMDTDVEVVRNLDDLLYEEAFVGVEKWQVLNFGSCSGAIKGHKSLEPFIEAWEKRRLIRDDGSLDKISSGLIDTSIALSYGYEINGTVQKVNGMNIYPYDFFAPYDYMTKKLEKTDNTFVVHKFNGGWV